MNDKSPLSPIEIQSLKQSSVHPSRDEEQFLNAFIGIAQRAMDDYHKAKKMGRKVLPVSNTGEDCK
ncbi:hypothetical protein KQI37_21480 [Bacillus halotolerans]|uniref:hypothetical protein n=1 Tax=Bacillus halotolerans TaxID=260554 RepID=UPI001C0EDBB9|nr:hypothetical protein [Bacillus halotolerans]MBU5248168.1 hypothetical protein [Bacillus halotolerans]